jgi:hypothetical protein
MEPDVTAAATFGLFTLDIRTRHTRNSRSPPRQTAGRASVKRQRFGSELTLRVLLSLTGLLETSLLTLDDAGVTAQVTGLLQGGAVVLGVDLVQ